MIPIIILAFTTGLCTGTALTYLLIRSYAAALVGALGSLLNFGLLLYVVSLREWI